MAHARLTLTGGPAPYSLKIDDNDLSLAVRKVTITVDPSQEHEAVALLEVLVDSIDLDLNHVTVTQLHSAESDKESDDV